MRRAIPEIGIAESDVARAPLHLGADIGQDDLGGHRKETPAIERCDRAVQAGVLAAARRFGIASNAQLVAPLEASVTLKRRKLASLRDEKRRARYPRSAALRPCANARDRANLSLLKRGHEVEQRDLVFAANGRIDGPLEEMIGVEQRVKPVETDMRARIDAAHAPGKLFAQAQRRMHG